jgi:hypothetical protein
MTAGNNGASRPEDDDPFGYLYEDGQAAAGAGQRRQGGYGYPGSAAQPGVPRTSYNQVRTVGERRYGQQAGSPQQAYGQASHGQAPYGQQPNAQYAAAPPVAQPGPTATAQVPAQRGHGRGGNGGGPNTRGLLIGAVAVLAVVVIGITIATLSSGGEDDKGDAQPSSSPAASLSQSQQPGGDATGDKTAAPVELPKQDAATLTLTPPAALATDIAGAKGTGGAYVTMNGVGAAVTWNIEVPQAGAYTLYVMYGVPGKDAKTTLTTNDGKPQSVNMSNFAKAAAGDWAKGWTNTYAYITLNKGTNKIKISCEQGDQCEANLDQLQLKAGHL